MRASRFDAVGIALWVSLGAWSLLSAAVTATNPLPLLATLLSAAVVLVVARAAVSEGRPAAAAAVALLGLALLVTSLGGTTRGLADVAGPPLGYENANAAFFLQTSVGAAMVAASWGEGRVRVIGALAALVLLAVAAFTGSRAGLVLLPLVLVAGAAPPGLAVRLVTVVAAAAFLVALAATLVLAAGAPGSEPGGRPLVGPRGPRAAPLEMQEAAGGRVALWREALELIGAHPVVGVGPGAFGQRSGLARGDADRRWAHNEFLQMGAETGIPGFLVVVGLFLWGFGRLLLAPPDRLTGLAAASLGVVGAQASLDYILHFPVVVLAAAALAGSAHAPRGPGPGDTLRTFTRKALKAVVLPLGLVRRRGAGDLSVLLYHRVGSGQREIDLPAGSFRAQLADLSRRDGVRTIDEAVRDGGGVVVTVDDGYRDFHELFLPAAVDHGIPITLYLATSLVVEEGGDRTDGLTWANLRDAVATGLVTVGSHTHGHTNLAGSGEAQAREEMRRSKELVEDRLGVACRHFAFPWGVASPEADRVARQLFTSAARGWGTNRAGRLDLHGLRRTPVLRSDGPLLFRAKVAGMLDGEALVYRLARRGPWRSP